LTCKSSVCGHDQPRERSYILTPKLSKSTADPRSVPSLFRGYLEYKGFWEDDKWNMNSDQWNLCLRAVTVSRSGKPDPVRFTQWRDKIGSGPAPLRSGTWKIPTGTGDLGTCFTLYSRKLMMKTTRRRLSEVCWVQDAGLMKIYHGILFLIKCGRS